MILLAQESVDKICQVAKQQGFTERYSYSLDTSTDWDTIYRLSQSLSLFASRQILILILPESGPTAVIAENCLSWLKYYILIYYSYYVAAN